MQCAFYVQLVVK